MPLPHPYRLSEIMALASKRSSTKTRPPVFVHAPPSIASDLRVLFLAAFVKAQLAPTFNLFSRKTGAFLARSDLVALMLASRRRRSSLGRAGAAPRHAGGAELGLGRDGTRVYTADELPDSYPDALRTCVYLYGSPKSPVCVPASKGVGITSRDVDPSTVAVKDIQDENEALIEAHLHELVHEWFAASNDPEACILHPVLSSADMVLSGEHAHRVVFYQAMDGDTSALRLSSRDLLGVADACLRCLVVLHAHRTLHMDIKPHNIMFKRRSSHNATFSFLLGDFGLATPMSAALSNLIYGGSPNGTDGYMSPLLVQPGKDADNNVIPRFQAVAEAVGLRAASVEKIILAKQEALKKRSSSKHDDQTLDVKGMPKTDLHSLALSLLALLRWSKAQPIELTLAENPVVANFIGKLMFFRARDYSTASAALTGARRAAAELLQATAAATAS